MESRFKRICISGASGTGKTTLAEYISGLFNIPFVSSSSGKLWPDYGYKNHSDVVRDTYMRPATAHSFQINIATYRDNLWGKYSRFITDRGPIDHAAYYLNYFQLHSDNYVKTQMMKRLLDQLHNNFDAVIFINYNQPTIEDNGKRILDPYFQMYIDAGMKMVMERVFDIHIPVLNIPVWDLDIRKEMVNNFLT